MKKFKKLTALLLAGAMTMLLLASCNGGSGGGNVSSAQINTIVALDRAEYDALAVKDVKTLYLIQG